MPPRTQNPDIFWLECWLAAAASAALAALAAWADHRRARRRNLDRPGWMPWQLILVLAMMASVVCVALGVLV